MDRERRYPKGESERGEAKTERQWGSEHLKPLQMGRSRASNDHAQATTKVEGEREAIRPDSVSAYDSGWFSTGKSWPQLKNR